MAEQIDTSTRTQLNDVEVRNSSVKQTPNTSFGQVLRSGISGTSNAVSGQLGSAGYIIPGASVVGAAISGIGNVRDSSSPTASGVGIGGGLGGLGGGGGGSLGGVGGGASRILGSDMTSGGSTGGGTNGSAGLATGGNSSQALLSATAQLTESNNQFNLQYLGLQENMQQENREFTAVSNVIKAKNDTAKNSLSNLK